MPRNGSGVYSLPAGSTFTPNTLIQSSVVNGINNDLATDANTPRPIVAGGTGATSFSGVVTSFSIPTAVRTQIFVASGTYTPDPNMIYAIIEGCGGGAGGGGAVGNASAALGGGGGGAGAAARGVFIRATIGASQSVTIGAGGPGGTGAVNGSNGGSSTVGAIWSAAGGQGGAFGSTGQIGTGGPGGAAGVPTAIAASPGGAGIFSISAILGAAIGGQGGSSIWGGGGRSAANGGAGGSGINSTGFGGGGSGAFTDRTTGNFTGGAGSAGIVYITEFCTL